MSEPAHVGCYHYSIFKEHNYFFIAGIMHDFLRVGSRRVHLGGLVQHLLIFWLEFGLERGFGGGNCGLRLTGEVLT